MELREGIKSQFSLLGFELTDAVLDKCVEICVLHNIDDEEFAETWMAYSITHLNGEVPTVETLAQMERKELSSKDKTPAYSSSSRQATTSLTVYNKTPSSSKKNWTEQRMQLDTTPKGSKNEGVLPRQLVASGSNGTFSPASFSPISTTPSGKYSARSNAGECVCQLTQRVAGDWKAKDQVSLTIAPYRDEPLTSNCRIMMEPLRDKMEVLNDVIERIGSFLIEKNELQHPQHNRKISPVEMVCVGRICCDSNDHLNPCSVLLEGSRQLCYGEAVPLDLDKLTHYSLFPGQIVAVEAVNPSGRRLMVNRLFHSAPLPSPQHLPRFSSPIEIVVAAGPFTQSGSLAFEPLEDLMSYVKSHRPHVLILIGPLVDLRQAQLTTSSLAETFEDLFNKIVKGVMDQLKGSWTQVVVVASARDGTCLPVYPTPSPLGPRPSPSPSLHLVSDPSLLSINGLVVGLTATDSLLHLGKEEISYPPASSDRLGRLASHLLQQQNFYPLSPPHEELAVDSELWDSHASLPVTPHVLVVPSNFRHFLKHLHGCLVVNPEYLVKGEVGGTFARLEVEPPSGDTWSPLTHISAQVLKI